MVYVSTLATGIPCDYLVEVGHLYNFLTPFIYFTGGCLFAMFLSFPSR